MIIKEVKHIKDGDILASPVLAEEKEILLEAGTVLKKEYAKLLLSMSVFYVEIEDSYEAYEFPKFIDSFCFSSLYDYLKDSNNFNNPKYL